MIPRIKRLETRDDYMLFVIFDDDKRVIYDVKEDIDSIPDFEVLRTEQGLFKHAQLDESRTCVCWSDRVDLPSDTLLEYGRVI